MEKMTDEEIARELSSMSADQVRNIQKQYGKMFPEDKNRSEFVKLLLEEKKNAPDSAATPSQGNGTRQHA